MGFSAKGQDWSNLKLDKLDWSKGSHAFVSVLQRHCRCPHGVMYRHAHRCWAIAIAQPDGRRFTFTAIGITIHQDRLNGSNSFYHFVDEESVEQCVVLYHMHKISWTKVCAAHPCVHQNSCCSENHTPLLRMVDQLQISAFFKETFDKSYNNPSITILVNLTLLKRS